MEKNDKNLNIKKAVFMSKNAPLMTVVLKNNEVVDIIDIVDKDKLPFSFKDDITIENFNKWIKKRLISENREGFKDVKEVFSGFEDYGAMFSLTDQYWFKFSSKAKWEDGNFFNKRYNRNFGYMFFYPWEVDIKSVGLPSPDMTTNGLTRKRWIQYKGSTKSYLIKSRDQDGRQDPINEVIASKFLKKLGFIDVVEYDLVIDGLRFSSKCANFIDEETEFVPASHICTTMPKNAEIDFYEYIVLKCDELGLEGARDYLNRMITADYLIKNVDRHYGNFGFIRDVQTGKLKDFAPLFDFGLSFTKLKSNQKKKQFFSDKRIKEAIKYTNEKYHIPLKQSKKEELLEVLDYYPFVTAV